MTGSDLYKPSQSFPMQEGEDPWPLLRLVEKELLARLPAQGLSLDDGDVTVTEQGAEYNTKTVEEAQAKVASSERFLTRIMIYVPSGKPSSDPRSVFVTYRSIFVPLTLELSFWGPNEAEAVGFVTVIANVIRQHRAEQQRQAREAEEKARRERRSKLWSRFVLPILITVVGGALLTLFIYLFKVWTS